LFVHGTCARELRNGSRGRLTHIFREVLPRASHSWIDSRTDSGRRVDEKENRMFCVARIRNKLVLSASLLGLLNTAGCPQSETIPADAAVANDQQSAASAQAAPGSTAGVASPTAPILFVSDTVNGVLAFSAPATADGDVAPKNHIWGTYGYAAWLVSSVAVGVDRSGALVALTSNDGISVFKGAQSATGNRTPDRDIYGPSTGLSLDAATNDDLIFDRTNDRALACNYAGVFVFDRFSADSRQGDIAPTRTITSIDLKDPHSLALGPNGDLYVADVDKVAVFAGGGARDGAIRADRIIQLPAADAVVAGTLSHPASVFVDAQDRLYVIQSEPGFVYVLDQASARAGTVAPDRVIDFDFDLSSSSSKDFYPIDVVVDAQGVGYILDALSAAIRVVDNIAARTGTITPDRTIQGPTTKLEQPNALFVWE
jgi:hypothetical protein